MQTILSSIPKDRFIRSQRICIEGLIVEICQRSKTCLQAPIQSPNLHIDTWTNICGLQIRFYFPQLIDLDLAENNFVRSIKSVIDVIEQQSSNNDDHRCTDHQEGFHP